MLRHDEGVIRVEQLLDLLQGYWPLVACLLVVVALFQVFVRSLFRLVSLFVFLGVILVLVFQYSPDQVIEMGRSIVKSTQNAVNQTVTPLLEAELQDADIDFHEDGSYEVRTASLRIVGKKGESRATVYYKDQKYEVDIRQFHKLLFEQLEKQETTKTTL
jgi:hypothetical protein